jgi:GNAT superfamily N-acetyltransferase
MIVVRVATVSDFELLATIGKRAFSEAFARFNDPEDMKTYLETAFNPETIRQQLSDPEVVYFFATYDGVDAGYAKLKRNSTPKELPDSRCIQLERIYVLQSYLGKKVGKELMEKCLKTALSEHFEIFWLGVWQRNERAIKFYKKWGLEVIGFKQFIIGKEISEDFVMALKLKKLIIKQ